MTGTFTASNGVKVWKQTGSVTLIASDGKAPNTVVDVQRGHDVALREYFRAMETGWKPWHDAAPGDVWELTYGGQPTAHVFTERWAGGGEHGFVSDRAIVTKDDPDITDGRCIWPSRTA